MFMFSRPQYMVAIALAVAGLVLIGSWQTSAAQGWQYNESVIKKLELSSKTAKALKDKRYETQEKVAELHGQLRAARLKFREIMEQEKADKAEVDKAIEKIADLQMQIQKTRVHYLLFVENHLTPEQRQKVKTMVKRTLRAKASEVPARLRGSYGPVRDRMHRRDGERVVQGWDYPQRTRDRLSWSQRETEWPSRDIQAPFAPRVAQRGPAQFGRYYGSEDQFPDRQPGPGAHGAARGPGLPPRAVATE
jgi:Spy/CpxP family protein refolding chaperone